MSHSNNSRKGIKYSNKVIGKRFIKESSTTKLHSVNRKIEEKILKGDEDVNIKTPRKQLADPWDWD